MLLGVHSVGFLELREEVESCAGASQIQPGLDGLLAGIQQFAQVCSMVVLLLVFGSGTGSFEM